MEIILVTLSIMAVFIVVLMAGQKQLSEKKIQNKTCTTYCDDYYSGVCIEQRWTDKQILEYCTIPKHHNNRH